MSHEHVYWLLVVALVAVNDAQPFVAVGNNQWSSAESLKGRLRKQVIIPLSAIIALLILLPDESEI